MQVSLAFSSQSHLETSGLSCAVHYTATTRDSGTGTCADYCLSQGAVCKAAMDNVDGCVLDYTHRSLQGDSCSAVWIDQICLCSWPDIHLNQRTIPNPLPFIPKDTSQCNGYDNLWKTRAQRTGKCWSRIPSP